MNLCKLNGFFFRQLGYVSGAVSNEIYLILEVYMDGWLTEISCEGTESRLHLCTHGLWNRYDCSDVAYNAVQCGMLVNSG